MNISLLGPYGAGKGTQASKLVPKFNLIHISTGDLFREHLREKTELGNLIQDYLDKGELVPDSVADATMEEWLRVSDPRKGILFDGFPRTLRQAEFLEGLLGELDRSLDAVIFLQISDEEVTQRLEHRQICRLCHTPFHKTHNPFTSCPYDQCEGEHLYQRQDDDPEKVKTRLKVFHDETERLVDFYRQNEKLFVIEARKEIDQVFNGIVQSLQSKLTRK